jgi:hypothetical protein
MCLCGLDEYIAHFMVSGIGRGINLLDDAWEISHHPVTDKF